MTFGGRFAGGGTFFAGRFSPNSSPLARYNIGGKAPAVVADYSAGVYGLDGRAVTFDGLFDFARLSAAWKLNALGHWVKALAGEPRTGHHIWQGGQLVPAGVAICSEVRTQFLPYASNPVGNWNEPGVTSSQLADGFVRVVSDGVSGFPNINVPTIISSGTFTVQCEVREGSSGVAVIRLGGVDVGGSGLTVSAYEYTFATDSFARINGGVAISTTSQDRGNGVVLIAITIAVTSMSSFGVYPLWNDTTPDMSVDFRYTMISEGAYPSDFIANETASEVTVAAETLQIDAVTMAKAVGSPGAEEVTNGDFSDGLTDWPARSDAILSITGDGFLRVDNPPDDPVGLTSQAFSTVLGATYLVEINIEEVDGQRFAGISTSQSGARELLDFGISVNEGILKGFFVGTGGTVYIQMGAVDSGSYSVFSLATVRKVTMPEALSIAIEGYMTYEDEDSFNTVKLIEWRVSSDDYLEISLDTSGAETGEVNFKSNLGGVFTGAQSAPDAYSPGTEVHFSIALIVTATAIEGFCNGVSTGQIAHGGMADLLSAPTKLFPVGNATIKDFRIWPEALPSSDMLEATG